MPLLEVTVGVKVDGQTLGGFPLVRRLHLAEMERFDYQKVVGGATPLPASVLTTIQALIITSDQDVALALNGGTINLKAGGIIVIIDRADTTPDTVANSSGATATVRGLTAGN